MASKQWVLKVLDKAYCCHNGKYSLKKNWVNNSLHLWSEEISLVEQWISLDSNSSRVKIHYSASEISSGSLDIHSKRSDHWRHYPRSENRVNRVIKKKEYQYTNYCGPDTHILVYTVGIHPQLWTLFFPTLEFYPRLWTHTLKFHRMTMDFSHQLLCMCE